jgi:hypothetical protein
MPGAGPSQQKSNLSLARCNGTFQRQPEKPKTPKTAAKVKAVVAGAAVTAEPKLQTAVSAVSAVRKKSLGKVTVMRRAEDTAKDQVKATEHRKTHHAELLKAAERLAAARALKSDAANSTALVTTEAELDAKLAAKSGKGTKVEFLGKQITARQEGGRAFKYPQSAVGMAYRSTKIKSNPIRMTSDSGEDEVKYRTDLVKLMIAHDTQEGRYSAANLAVERQTELTCHLPPGSFFLYSLCGGCHVLSCFPFFSFFVFRLSCVSLFVWQWRGSSRSSVSGTRARTAKG